MKAKKTAPHRPASPARRPIRLDAAARAERPCACCESYSGRLKLNGEELPSNLKRPRRTNPSSSGFCPGIPRSCP